jgi:hypothetical protein
MGCRHRRPDAALKRAAPQEVEIRPAGQSPAGFVLVQCTTRFVQAVKAHCGAAAALHQVMLENFELV